MRLASIIVIAFGMAGCGGSLPPTSPAPPAVPVPTSPTPAPPTPLAGPGVLWVMVLSNGGSCLPAATVEVVIDGTVVQSGPQATPCDYWGDDGGILFKNLPIAEVTVRGKADGYVTREVKATPVSDGYSVTAVTLQRATTVREREPR